MISQQVESDATSPSLERSISSEIIPAVTYDGDHVADQDVVDDDEDHGQAISDVQKSCAVERTRRKLHYPNWLITNLIVTYALSVIEEAIPSTYREAKINSESKM